jgi:hypothetical protein
MAECLENVPASTILIGCPSFLHSTFHRYCTCQKRILSYILYANQQPRPLYLFLERIRNDNGFVFRPLQKMQNRTSNSPELLDERNGELDECPSLNMGSGGQEENRPR